MMTRTENVKRNTIFSIIKFAIQLVLQFVLRTVLIYTLGAKYLGVNGLFTNIFSLLNLAELGIGSAIVFSMYKPIAEGNMEQVKALNNLYKKLYFIIALVVGVLGTAITPFLPYLISGDTSGLNINIYIVYLLFLANTLIGYFSAHKRSLLFAFQRNDVESKVKSGTLIVSTALQIVVLLLFKNFYVYVILMVVGTLMDCILVQVFANKLYPEINGEAEPLNPVTKKEIIKNVAAMSMHKIGGAVVFSTDNILISALISLTVLGYYSNYTLIIESICLFIGFLITSLQAGVGNLMQEQSRETVFTFYKKINFSFAWIAGFCSISLLCLMQPFILIWTKNNNYLLSSMTLVLIVLSFYLRVMRSNTNMFKECAGLMWQDRWKPIAESVINLTASIVLAKCIGLNGIILGTIISTIVAPLWVEPFVLYKHYFKKSVWRYFGKFAFYTVVTAGAGALTYWLCSLLPFAGIGWFVLKCGICLVVPNVIFLLCYFKTNEFKGVIGLAKQVLKRKPKQTAPVVASVNISTESTTQAQGTMQTELAEQQNDSQVLPKETTQISVNNVGQKNKIIKKKTKTQHK